jgi:hypothetical protein
MAARAHRVAVLVAGLCAGLAAAACHASQPAAPHRATTPTPPATASSAAPPAADPTVVAAGDISPPRLAGQRGTSDLVRRLDPTRVLVLGDQQYPDGALADYRSYYDPTWGRFKDRTEPAPGNHEYLTPGARGYFDYFGAAATRRGVSYYSFDLGGWHLVSLDSNIGRDSASPQVAWLRRDLADTTARCVLAYWHHPRFSSGITHGDDRSVGPFWSVLHAAHADLVLNGHEHNYERFAPQRPDATADPAGIREFVVGTGGNSLYPFGPRTPNSERRLNHGFGVLRLTLHPTGYDWQYLAVDGTVLDRGGPEPCR